MFKYICLFILLSFNLFSQGGKTKLNADIENKENKILINIRGDKKTVVTQKRDEVVYVVKSGDTLSRIAKRYKKNISDIVRDNKIKNRDLIITGDILIIR